MNDTDKRKATYCEEICPSTTLPNRNPTKPGLGSNQNILGDKPATSRLKYNRVRDDYVKLFYV